MKNTISLIMLMALRHSCPSDTQTIVSELKFIANKLFHWLQYNHLEDIPGKSYLLLSSETSTDVGLY